MPLFIGLWNLSPTELALLQELANKRFVIIFSHTTSIVDCHCNQLSSRLAFWTGPTQMTDTSFPTTPLLVTLLKMI